MLKRYLYLSFIVGLIVLLTAVSCTPRTAETATAVNQTISPATYQADFLDGQADHLLVDVRTPEEFSSGHIPGATNIPLDTLEGRLSELPQDEPIVVYCRSGNRSAQAADILAGTGFSQIYDLGGIVEWTAQGLPVQ